MRGAYRARPPCNGTKGLDHRCCWTVRALQVSVFFGKFGIRWGGAGDWEGSEVFMPLSSRRVTLRSNGNLPSSVCPIRT